MNLVFQATREGDLKRLNDLFCGKGADPREVCLSLPDPDGEKLIHISSQGGHLDIVKYLVRHGVEIEDKDRRGNSPLHHAAYGGHLDVVEYLVGQGALVEKIDWLGKTPVQIASSGGHQDVVEFLLSKGAKPA
nr:ankyrin repeat domain-containing protein 65-like [Lytechinus pictus]